MNDHSEDAGNPDISKNAEDDPSSSSNKNEKPAQTHDDELDIDVPENRHELSSNPVIASFQNITIVIAAIGAVFAIYDKIQSYSNIAAVWAVWATVSYLAISVAREITKRFAEHHRHRRAKHKPNKKRKTKAISLVALNLPAIVIILSIIVGGSLGESQVQHGREAARQSQLQEEKRTSFELKLQTLRWIGYEPIHTDPLSKPPIQPKDADIAIELSVLRRFGFDGLITYGSDGRNGDIPVIAHRLGFKGIIMGITHIVPIDLSTNHETLPSTQESAQWDRNEIEEAREELKAALNCSAFVDAYALGHNFDKQRPIRQDDLLHTVEYLRDRTNLPITTTLPPDGYRAFPRISNSIDWFFPDVHADWYPNEGVEANPSTVFKETKFLINQIDRLRQGTYPDKPILLKMVSYPTYLRSDKSERNQFVFYRLILDYSQHSTAFPDRVYSSYQSAFDIPWKKESGGWGKGEIDTGLFGSVLFHTRPLNDLALLAEDLRDHKRPTSRYIFNQFSRTLQEELTQWKPPRTLPAILEKHLVDELNVIVLSGDLGNDKKWISLIPSLPHDIRIQLNRPKLDQRARLTLNRCLLERAFPGKIRPWELNPKSALTAFGWNPGP